MVETAVFSIFHRRAAPAQPTDEEQPGSEANIVVAPLQPVIDLQADTAPPAAQESLAAGDDILLEPETPPEAVISGVAPSSLSWLNLPVEHDFIGLANPAAWTVMASYSTEAAIEITADLTGLYRPANFRPAPWSGFAYDVAPDRRTGLVAGTRILTARGEIAVENLLPGDTAMALRGPALLPILWIGRCIAAEPPVVIEAGALGQQRPSRSLCVAADHPIFVDPVPIPAKRLVNGTTIHTTALTSAELFHIDVGRQEVLFAQNVPLASTQRPASGSLG